jgi:CcmD family protein
MKWTLLGLATWGLALMAQLSAQVQTNRFVPLDQARQQPEFSPAPLLYGAYAFVWAAVIVYVFTLWRRLGRVERELIDVNAKLTNPRRGS